MRLENSREGKHGKIEVKRTGESVKKMSFTFKKNVIKLSTYATLWANFKWKVSSDQDFKTCIYICIYEPLSKVIILFL
jgi:hypothetical protein